LRVKGLDGKDYKLSLSGRVAGKGDTRARSAGHLLARTLLLELFPFDPPYEEVTVPGCGGVLYLDFLLPARRLVVEVQGRQHRQPSKHFHKGAAGFRKQKGRDRRKREWAELNDLTLIELHDDDTDGWRGRLSNAFVAGDAAGEAG
jgi:hypothetical protein